MSAAHPSPASTIQDWGRRDGRVNRQPLESLDPAVYDALAGRSFFASRGFLELWRTQGGRPVVWTIVRDGIVVAALPGVEYGRGPLARFVAMPDGCYAKLLVHPRARDEAGVFADVLLHAVAEGGYGRVHLFDFEGRFSGSPLYARRISATQVVDVAQLARRPRTTPIRHQVGKAMREGIQCVDYDPGRHRAGFLRIADHTYRRHGVRSRYSPAFFDALARLAERDTRIVWRHCVSDGQAACSHIYFVENDMMLAWQAYFDKRFGFLKPNVFMRIEAAQDAAARGLRLLNFGATPFEAKGLLWFKDRWQSRQVTYSTHVHFGAIAAAVESLRTGSSAHADTAADTDPVEVA